MRPQSFQVRNPLLGSGANRPFQRTPLVPARTAEFGTLDVRRRYPEKGLCPRRNHNSSRIIFLKYQCL